MVYPLHSTSGSSRLKGIFSHRLLVTQCARFHIHRLSHRSSTFLQLSENFRSRKINVGIFVGFYTSVRIPLWTKQACSCQRLFRGISDCWRRISCTGDSSASADFLVPCPSLHIGVHGQAARAFTLLSLGASRVLVERSARHTSSIAFSHPVRPSSDAGGFTPRPGPILPTIRTR